MQLTNTQERKTSLVIVASMIAVVLAIATLPLHAAGAAPPQISRDPIVDMPPIGENPCNNEIVTFTGGVFQVVEHVFVDNADGFHFIAEGNARGATATGDDGGIYRATGGFWVEGVVRPGDLDVFTDVEVFNLIGRGSTPNFIAHITVHITVNANGDLTTDIFLENTECRG